MAGRVGFSVTMTVAASVAAVALAAPPAAAAGPKAGWSISYHLPVQTGSTDKVNAIAATGPGDAWAVGGKLGIVNKQAVGVPAVFHWNGKSWSQVTLPGPAHVGYFSAVSASSATDVWAIGGCDQGCTAFAANWNGKKWTWHSSVATTPDSAMAAFSQSDVWVADYTYLDRWTGRSWRRYAAPGWNGVWTLAGAGANNIWAAGLAVGGLQPEVLHWNGASWKAASLPHITLPVDGQAVPKGIAADSASNVWVDGTIQYSQGTEYKPFVLHWNGSAWGQLAVPASFPADFGLSWIASDGAGGFWADATSPSASGTSLPVKLVHYSGGRWTITPLPAIPGSAVTPSAPEVDDLTQVPGTRQVWAPVAYFANPSGAPRDAILHYSP
jgi:hypothetical protein